VPLKKKGLPTGRARGRGSGGFEAGGSGIGALRLGDWGSRLLGEERFKKGKQGKKGEDLFLRGKQSNRETGGRAESGRAICCGSEAGDNLRPKSCGLLHGEDAQKQGTMRGVTVEDYERR